MLGKRDKWSNTHITFLFYFMSFYFHLYFTIKSPFLAVKEPNPIQSDLVKIKMFKYPGMNSPG